MNESGDVSAIRASRNQSLFRQVNQRVEEVNQAFDALLPVGEWVCECANEECVERLTLTHEEYELVRSNPARFLVAPDDAHFFPDVEIVVERHERYWVVEKIGVAAKVAKKHDARLS